MSRTESENPLPSGTVFLVGPTAVGKSSVALTLAESLGAEIVSADSVQVYRGMDIGTAKPTPEERIRVRHHLIDVVDVSEKYDAARFRRDGLAAMKSIVDRGKRPLVVGGSGMYVRALLQGLADLPPADPEIRRSLEDRLDREGADALHERLRRVDPVSAASIDPRNARRLIRALEVYEQTGRPFSSWKRQWGEAARGLVFGLSRDRGDLAERIHRRVDAMFDLGLVEEVRELAGRGLRRNPSAARAVGYRQVLAMLDGEIPPAEAPEAVKSATRALARRQLTWFRHQISVEWIPLDEGTRDDEAAERILEAIERRDG